MRGRLFRLGVVTTLALGNHSLTLIYVDVSMIRHRVLYMRQATQNSQTIVIVDITATTNWSGRQNTCHALCARCLQFTLVLISS
jgi:precorrin isomerase